MYLQMSIPMKKELRKISKKIAGLWVTFDNNRPTALTGTVRFKIEILHINFITFSKYTRY